MSAKPKLVEQVDEGQSAAPEPKPQTLAQKMCLIMGECGHIEKKGVNAFHKYTYLREADISEAIRRLMAKYGVFCLPSTEEIQEQEHKSEKGTVRTYTRVKIKYTFINAENP